MKVIYYISLIFLVLSCKSQVNKHDQHQVDVSKSDSLSLKPNNFSIMDTSLFFLKNRVLEHVRNTEDTTKLGLLNTNLNLSHSAGDSLYLLEEFSIKHDSLSLLFVEVYTHKFPIMVNKVYAVIYNRIETNFIDTLEVFKDINVGIKNCDEKFFVAEQNQIKIYERDCNNMITKDSIPPFEVYRFKINSTGFKKLNTIKE